MKGNIAVVPVLYLIAGYRHFLPSYSFQSPTSLQQSLLAAHLRRRVLTTSWWSSSSTPGLFAISGDEVTNNSTKEDMLRKEAINLIEKAQALRKQLPVRSNQNSTTWTDKSVLRPQISKWNIPLPIDYDDDSLSTSSGYRLYADIGREDGTWMEPRWGASLRRIEFTIDIQFSNTPITIESGKENRMVQDNFGGTKSPIYNLKCAPYARLRNGFDEMKCLVDGGAYRIDGDGKNGSRTVRFYIPSDGTNDTSYGDIQIPAGPLYFSIPCFSSSVVAPKHLSSKEGVVSVRQIGWHTGWRRMESRIVGLFRAIPIDIAKQRDGF